MLNRVKQFKCIKRLVRHRKFKQDIRSYCHKHNEKDSFPFHRKDVFYVSGENEKNAGNIDGHYFLQDIYMARKVQSHAPTVHYDIGSRVDGFISHLLCSDVVKKVVMLDIRPLPIEIEHLQFVQADATNLEELEDNSIASLSSLHAIEHFGLGRYGDDIDPEAWKKVLAAVQRKVQEGGMLYLSVPVGPENKLCFNAHRIFKPSTIVDRLPEFELLEFMYIYDMRITEINVRELWTYEKNLPEYACGCFVLKKRSKKIEQQ